MDQLQVRTADFQLIAATFSPMDGHGAINCSAVEPYAEYLLDKGVSTIFVNGTSGESLSLTTDERRALAEAWVRFGADSMKVMVHVGANAIGDSVVLAKHASEIGAAAISAMAPTFFRPKSVDDLIAFLQPIAAAAPRLPFYFYYIPSITRVELSLDEFLQKCEQRIPSLAGVKYTHHNLVEYGQCHAKWSDRFHLLFGKDELMLPAMSVGASGFIGTSYNLAPRSFARIIDAFARNDLTTARELSVIVNQFVLLMVKNGYLAYGKRLLSAMGIDCGSVRPPLEAVESGQFDQLLNTLNDLPLPDRLACQEMVDGQKVY